MKQATSLSTPAGCATVALRRKTVTLVAVLLAVLCRGSDGRSLRLRHDGLGDRHLATSSLVQKGKVGSAQEPVPEEQTYEKWNYEDKGTQSWAELGQCGEVGQQSPIDISTTEAIVNNSNSLYYRFATYSAPIQMLNNALTHALEATIDEDAGILALGSLYPSRLTANFKLKRIVFHSPSEHTFKGVRVPLEMQMHYEGMITDIMQPKVAVTSLGFYPDPNGNSPFLDALRQGGLPVDAGQETTVNSQSSSNLDFDEIYGPSDHAKEAVFWQYDGSETTPPCSVGILWFVRDDPLPASLEAITEFREVITAGAHPDADSSDRGNFRALQSGVGRQVHRILTKDAAKWPALPKEDPAKGQAAVEAAQASLASGGGLTPPMWDEMVGQAQAYQQDANLAGMGGLPNAEGLSQEELNARNARRLAAEREAEKNKVLSGASGLEVCMKTLTRIRADREEAVNHAAVECEGKEKADEELEEAGGGLAHLAAAKIKNGQTALCTQADKVVKALEEQAVQQEINCKALEPPAPAGIVIDLPR